MNLSQVYKRFPTNEECLKHLERARWNGIPKCPYCKSPNSTSMENELRHHCNTCNTSFSVTVGTIFHKTHLDLQKWFLAIALILDSRKGLSSRQLAKHLEVNKNTAWSISFRINKAMIQVPKLLQDIIELDEVLKEITGGKA